MMGFFKLIFCLIFLLPPPINGKIICKASSCGNNTFPVKFPFRLQDQQQPTSCGYPGFDLVCNNQGILTLKLPQSGEFFVRSIDYMNQEIRLYDPYGCMPKRFPELDLTGSPFIASSYMNFSFFSCPANSSWSSSSYVIKCLSNSTNIVLAVLSLNVDLYSFECHKFSDQPIRLPESFRTYYNIFSKLEDYGIPFTWNEPDCGDCESSGDTCGFASSQRVKCFGSPPTAAKGVRIFGVISVIFIIFGIIFVFVIRVRRMSTATTTAQVQNFHPPAGLDETTIQSYTKVVLGESCRLPGGASDGTCPICLCEYNAKETVKCIPECKHCFHADCIDEWLRLTGTCPICRKTPSLSQTIASL